MSEGELNALRFMSTVVVGGVTNTSPNTLLPKKKKKQSNKMLSKLQWNTYQ